LRNQPKYHFLKNTKYALNGLIDLIKTETSFRIEIILFVILMPVIIFIDAVLVHKLFMFMSLMGILMAETINSAIERVVDLVTMDYNQMAGRAKDIGSTIVFLSIFVFIVTWVVILLHNFWRNS